MNTARRAEIFDHNGLNTARIPLEMPCSSRNLSGLPCTNNHVLTFDPQMHLPRKDGDLLFLARMKMRLRDFTVGAERILGFEALGS